MGEDWAWPAVKPAGKGHVNRIYKVSGKKKKLSGEILKCALYPSFSLYGGVGPGWCKEKSLNCQAPQTAWNKNATDNPESTV